MTTTDSRKGSSAQAAQNIGSLLAAFSDALPHLECRGLYASRLEPHESRFRFIASQRLCEAIEANWSRQYQNHLVPESELTVLEQAIEESTLGLTGAEIAWLLSVLGERLRERIARSKLH